MLELPEEIEKRVLELEDGNGGYGTARDCQRLAQVTESISDAEALVFYAENARDVAPLRRLRASLNDPAQFLWRARRAYRTARSLPERLVHELRFERPLTVAELAERTGAKPNSVRSCLNQRPDLFVRAGPPSRGGRPVRWTLTEEIASCKNSHEP